MTTYIDDGDVDAAKALCTLVWNVVRTQFNIKDPVGVVRESRRGLRLAQCEHAVKRMEDPVTLGFGPIRVCTTVGQSGTHPDPEQLPGQPCDPGVREVIGSLLFLSRCTRLALSHAVARPARFVTWVVRVGARRSQTCSWFGCLLG